MNATRRPEGLDDAFLEGPAPAALPAIGLVGWLRWAWRQLTSMRVALLLLMLLAVAAVPGTMVPQRAQNPEKVTAFLQAHTTAGPWLDRLGFFSVYTSVWFSAIYLLLFVSLVGCIVPRVRLHAGALRGRPPRTPARFGRFPARGQGTSPDQPHAVVMRAAAVLRAPHRIPWVPSYRVDVHDEGAGTWSVSAERGYLRETGNLVFHLALVGLLVAIATGQLLHYRGQVLVVTGHGFANAQAQYDTFESGSAFDPASLVPFTVALDSFEAVFDPQTLAARDFTANVTLTEPGEDAQARTIKVNHPLTAGGALVYLQGNGYAPDLEVTDAAGEVAFSGPVTFLPQDSVYTSRGVVKVPDVSGGQAQIGLSGYLLPTAVQMDTTTWRSVSPQADDPLLVLTVWSGDLGLDTGVPQNVYTLDTTDLTQSVTTSGQPVTLYLRPGETVELPDGLGSVTFKDLPRYVALDLRYDPATGWVLAFSLVALAGLAASLFAPRRRLWLRAGPATDRDQGPTVVTAAGLARGDDLGLDDELDRVLAATVGRSPAGSGAPPAGTSDEVTAQEA
ncbi:MAG: cytochrome c biogenesis protein ResB [Cellulomonas sp.]|nr:cytochrome c biogenesis protein ResB [Cellulomonas sp.]